MCNKLPYCFLILVTNSYATLFFERKYRFVISCLYHLPLYSSNETHDRFGEAGAFASANFQQQEHCVSVMRNTNLDYFWSNHALVNFIITKNSFLAQSNCSKYSCSGELHIFTKVHKTLVGL